MIDFLSLVKDEGGVVASVCSRSSLLSKYEL